MFKRMDLVTIGCGDTYDMDKFEVPTSNLIKPTGGFWASPVNSEMGWARFCEVENFAKGNGCIYSTFEGNLYVVDSRESGEDCPSLRGWGGMKMIDVDALMERGYDGIYMTVQGVIETRSMNQFCAWDVESVYVMNFSSLAQVETC